MSSALPPSRSPVFAKAREIAKAAAADYLSTGIDPSEAIVKAGGADLSLSGPFRGLVCSQANHAIFRGLRQFDKLAEYPVATVDKVEAIMGRMEKSASEQVVSDVWSRDIKNAAFTKVATRLQNGVDVDALGIPVGLKEPVYNTTSLTEAKLAADYSTSRAAAELERQAAYELDRLFAETKTGVTDFIRKQAMFGQDAFAVGFGLVSNVDEEKKAEAAVFVDRCIRGMIESGTLSKTAAARYDESVKTAALDWLSQSVPVSRGSEMTVIQLNTMLNALDDDGSRLPRTIRPGDQVQGGADMRVRYQATDALKAPQGGTSMIARDAKTVFGHEIF